MKSLFKWLLVIGLIYIGATTFKYMRAYMIKVTADPNHHDVLDGLTGKMAVDYYTDIKEKQDTFNLPAFRTGMVMFYTQNGHYPRDIQEMDQSGDISPDLTHDRFGSLYELRRTGQNSFMLHSAGRDRIQGTTDDVEYTVQM